MTTDTASNETALALAEQNGIAALEHVLGTGDLSLLSNEQRVGHYLRLCRSLGLNELSRPFDWLILDDRLVLYPNQSCAAQLRRQHHMRIEITRRAVAGDLFVAEARATTPDGRVDVASKYVPLIGKYGRLQGQHLANAMMKAETGAKRRVTFSMVGLSLPPGDDEPNSWRPVVVDGTGRVIENPTDSDLYLAQHPSAARAIGEPVFEDLPGRDQPPAASQAVRPAELERPSPQPRERATFGMDVKRALGAWFSIVKDTYLDDDDARHAFVEAYTEQRWPQAARTDSLRTFFRRATEVQAQEFLAHVRALCEIERANAHDDVVLRTTSAGPRPPTDVPADPEPVADFAVQLPEPPDPERQYSRTELLALYDEWAVCMRSLDSAWTADDVKRMTAATLRNELGDLVAQATDLYMHLAEQPAEDDTDQEPF